MFPTSSYDSGDHVAIYPVNDEVLVKKMLTLTKTDGAAAFSLINTDEDSSKKHPFPCPTTYATALRHYVDITSTPRTHVLKELAEYATNPEVRTAIMLKLSSPHLSLFCNPPRPSELYT